MADSWLKYMGIKSNSVQDDPGLGIQSHPPPQNKTEEIPGILPRN
jgi:hypothetical protein